VRRLSACAVPGLPEVADGDDLGGMVVSACAAAGIGLRRDDVLAVASKVVAKAEGRFVPASSRDAAVAAQTVREVAARSLPDGRVTRVVQSRSGPVLAAAGVDASDVAAGRALLLPADPDGSARALRARVAAAAGVRPAVVVTDTAGRPWRAGVSDFALGAAGLVVLDDTRGRPDRFGRPLEVTVRAVADEVAAAADLVKGKAAGTPVAVVRGLGEHVTDDDGPGASGCVRVGPTDWFAYGQVEAVRAALGVAPGEVPAPPLDPASDPAAQRVARAVAVACAGRAPSGVSVRPDGDKLVVDGPPVLAGAMAERLRVALWAEGVPADAATGSAVPLVVRLLRTGDVAR
jgi:coenzyme F420-0:L-glutamate ligase/coenzyme F420-1:gamma-L-glutamate ligase